jgi:hypothetical protein
MAAGGIVADIYPSCSLGNFAAVRAMFLIYVVGAVVGITYFAIIGITNH